MREWRQVAGGADRTLGGDAWMEPAVIELEQSLDEQRTNAGIAARQALDLERERHAHGRVVQQWPGAGGVRQHDVPLQLLELVIGDPCLRQPSETGVDESEER